MFEAGASPFQPLETSHLGGDRFAATGVVFPTGSMYAHLDSKGLAAVLEAEAQGRIVPQLYRGGAFEPQLTQIVRSGLARDNLFNDLKVPLEVERAPESKELAHARAGEDRFEVSLTVVEVAFFGSCEDLAEGRRSVGRRTAYASGRRA